MGHVNDAGYGSQQRVLGDPEEAPSGAQASLHTQVASLKEELAGLRLMAREKASLDETVTQLREANQHLVLAAVNAQTRRDDAEEANRRQTEFLAMLAHELRNPLAPIATAATLLGRMSDASTQAISLSKVIARQVVHMSHLLDDLLDAARISSGKITLSLQTVHLDHVIEQAVETVAPRMRERGHELTVALAQAPVVVHGDRERLAQVFTNLLSNACKYTGEGGRIRLAVVPQGEQVLVTVEDNGSGIVPELLPYIFDLFTQGQRSLARLEGGLGIGLSVVRNLVEMHSGRVEAYSAGPGLGSCFSVTLPVSEEKPALHAPHSKSVTATASLSILLIEDNQDACETMRSLLELEGHRVCIANDGDGGLTAALEGSHDALVCDIGLPGIDGLELIARLRRSANGRKPYAIALSGYCQPEDRSRALEAGFDSYCVKPVSAEALLALLAAGQRRRARN